MSWTDAITQLQEADIELLNNQKRLMELAALLQNTTEVQAAMQRLEGVQATAKKTRLDQETLEFELGKVQNKLSADTQRLYSGRITNSRELQDLQAETESLKRHITSLEDKLLEAMMVREEADNDLSISNKELEHIRNQTAESQKNSTQEQTALESRNTDLSSLMADLQQQIPASILDTYQYLKPRTANIPVAQLKGEICGVCGIEVIKPMQQKARRNEEAYCGGCNRLLVVLD